MVSGEYVRSDVREDQEGVPLYVDIELIDINTCEPVPDLYMDFWHANATGVYSGIVASGNGDSSDASNLVSLRRIYSANFPVSPTRYSECDLPARHPVDGR